MDPTVITPETFSQALSSGNHVMIVGIVLMILTFAIHYVIDGKISDNNIKIFSIVRGVATGIGTSLISVGPSNGDWKIAVIVGTAGLLLSQGFLDTIRSVIPSKTKAPTP